MNSEQIGIDRYERIEDLRDRQREARRRLKEGDENVAELRAELADIAETLERLGERP